MTTEAEDRETLRRRNQNEPLWLMPARHDGYRAVRVKAGGKDRGLLTTAYSYALTAQEKVETAERVAALWNLAAACGWDTQQINAMAVAAWSKRQGVKGVGGD